VGKAIQKPRYQWHEWFGWFGVNGMVGRI